MLRLMSIFIQRDIPGPDQKAVRTSPISKCLCAGSLWQIFWPHWREVLDNLKIHKKILAYQCHRDLTKICAVGFEPNVLHNEVLRRLQDHYQACGWRVGWRKWSSEHLDNLRIYKRRWRVGDPLEIPKKNCHPANWCLKLDIGPLIIYVDCRCI